MKLQRSELDTIIFDMDGVITSEQGYWYTAALTVYELMFDHRYYGRQEVDHAWCRKHYDMLYDIIFCGGRTVEAVKRLGVNTNWDLAYVVFCVASYLNPQPETFEPTHFESVCMFLENMQVQPPEIYVGLEGLLATVIPREVGYFKRGSGVLWEQVVAVFQRWFHGDAEASGLIELEEPLLPIAEIEATLKTLKQAGFRLGIGTGRIYDEIAPPLKSWGLDGYFDRACWATYDAVEDAERVVGAEPPLAKPHPFIFWKAAFGDRFSDQELAGGAVTAELASRCLVVGDAASDLLAAQSGGFRFAAVLTGITGESGRSYFEESHADWIFDSVLDIRDALDE